MSPRGWVVAAAERAATCQSIVTLSLFVFEHRRPVAMALFVVTLVVCLLQAR